jgi:prevent-host-death family protein
MRRAHHVGSRELKIRLGSYLRRVRAGQVIVVTDRGEPVAELRPLPSIREPRDAVLARLELEGRVRRPTARLQPFVPVSGKPGRAVADAIVEDREDRF